MSDSFRPHVCSNCGRMIEQPGHDSTTCRQDGTTWTEPISDSDLARIRTATVERTYDGKHVLDSEVRQLLARLDRAEREEIRVLGRDRPPAERRVDLRTIGEVNGCRTNPCTYHGDTSRRAFP